MVLITRGGFLFFCFFVFFLVFFVIKCLYASFVENPVKYICFWHVYQHTMLFHYCKNDKNVDHGGGGVHIYIYIYVAWTFRYYYGARVLAQSKTNKNIKLLTKLSSWHLLNKNHVNVSQKRRFDNKIWSNKL